MNQVLDFIAKKRRCFDGATGTMLMKMGLEVGGCPEQVSEDILLRIHQAYIRAGAQFITTNTFGGSRPKLAKYDLGDRVSEINRRNTAVAKRAVTELGVDISDDEKRVYVAGDIGPTGEFIHPYGDFTAERFKEVFSEQARALADGGADVIIIETMAATEEMQAALEAAKTAVSLPVLACMTFNRNPGGEYRTMMGVSPDQAVRLMEEAGADVIGTNCSLTPPDIVDLVKELSSLTTRPLLVQPNAGQPRLVDNQTTYQVIPEIEKHLVRIIEAGADIVGGCCGTDPDYVRLLRGLLDEKNP